MSWFGKLTFGAVGLLLGGPLGAIAGAALGHILIDKQSGLIRRDYSTDYESEFRPAGICGSGAGPGLLFYQLIFDSWASSPKSTASSAGMKSPLFKTLSTVCRWMKPKRNLPAGFSEKPRTLLTPSRILRRALPGGRQAAGGAGVLFQPPVSDRRRRRHPASGRRSRPEKHQKYFSISATASMKTSRPFTSRTSINITKFSTAPPRVPTRKSRPTTKSSSRIFTPTRLSQKDCRRNSSTLPPIAFVKSRRVMKR